jgi:hypothetical protein
MNEEESYGHLLSDQPIGLPSFILEVPNLLSRLGQITGCDYSASITDSTYPARVDAALTNMQIEEILDPTLFPLLVAFVGEYLRQEWDGRWVTELNQDYNVWEPYVEHPLGYLANPWFGLYKAVLDGHPDAVAVSIVLERRSPTGKIQ